MQRKKPDSNLKYKHIHITHEFFFLSAWCARAQRQLQKQQEHSNLTILQELSQANLVLDPIFLRMFQDTRTLNH